MRKAMIGIAAAAGIVACPAVWRPGMAEGEATLQPDRAFPDPLSAAEASLWDRLRERGRPDELEAFLVLFPQSRFAAEARRRREDLAVDARQQRRPEEEVRPQPPRRQEPIPPKFSAAAAAAAVAPDCGLLASAANETSITVAGALRRGQEKLVQSMLDAFGVPAEAVRLRLDPFEGPYCGALSALLMNTIVPPPDAPPRVALLGARPLPDGERLRLRVEMPEWPAHLAVFYLAVSSEVASLVSDPQPRHSGASVVLEDPRWKVAAPFGTDLVLVVASEVPLFEQRRPAAEKLEDFTPALAAALQRARRVGARVAARVMVVETAAR